MPNLPLEVRLNSILRSKDFDKVKDLIRRYQTGPNHYKALDFCKSFNPQGGDHSLIVEKYQVNKSMMKVTVDGVSDYYCKTTLAAGKNTVNIKSGSEVKREMHIKEIEMFYSGSFEFGRGIDSFDQTNWFNHVTYRDAMPMKVYTSGT